ncbi:MurR/RpiR family transcriptional regulator [Humitalea sp. 24SJ18S-53]|uniref:MurR/RpiR family transcriptional regulator n=1 Tax=Humitalea sp. 24SJ18S-53 TaxID=3422307 RepID=UPI003D675230
MLADRLNRALPNLPPALAAAGRHLAAHPFEVATRPMRSLAAEAGASPASFTRLAQALGFDGWDALRDAAIAEQRPVPAPYSARPRAEDAAAVLVADVGNVADLNPAALQAAAATLHLAPRIHVAGFRSCRAVASLLHYQLRLFRTDPLLLDGEGALDLDLAAFRPGDALVLVGFAPYSRASLMTLAAARDARLRIVVLADRADAPITAGVDHVLPFATATPAFFPSLTAAVALAQALAASVFAAGGADALAALRASENLLDRFAAYLPEDSVA